MKVKVEEEYWISCNVTGDNAPTNPWFHNGDEVQNNTETGILVTTVPLEDAIGVTSTIIFTKGVKDQLGDYSCSALDGKPNATVSLKEAGKWNVQFECVQPMMLVIWVYKVYTP